MPLLTPLSQNQIHEVLRELQPKDRSLKEILNDNGAGIEQIAETVGEVMRGADTSGARLQAAKLASELNGLLESDVVKPVPIVNIVIQGSRVYDVNPIFLPREIDIPSESKELTNG